MKHKHQIKVSSSRGRTLAGREDRRQLCESLRKQQGFVRINYKTPKFPNRRKPFKEPKVVWESDSTKLPGR